MAPFSGIFAGVKVQPQILNHVYDVPVGQLTFGYMTFIGAGKREGIKPILGRDTPLPEWETAVQASLMHKALRDLPDPIICPKYHALRMCATGWHLDPFALSLPLAS